MNRLVFPAPVFTNLRSHLLNSSLERAAVVFAHPVKTEGGWHLIASDIDVVQDDAYSHQEPDSLEIPPHIIARQLKHARENGLSIILTHTHPWNGPVEPSHADRLGEQRLLPVLFQRARGGVHGRLIFGHRDTSAGLFLGPDEEVPLEVREVGAQITIAPEKEVEDGVEEIYDRQVRAFGAEGQRRISSQNIAIVGLGGTGSVVAQTLAHLGVRRFSLVDPDSLEVSNLNRVVGATLHDAGFPKVDVAARLIKRIQPAAEVQTLCADVTLRSVAKSLVSADFVFSCTDTHGSRAVLSQLSYQYFVPMIDLGVRIDAVSGRVRDVVGRVQMLAPGLACTNCTGLLDPESVRRDLLSPDDRLRDKYIVGATINQPSVISINTSVAGAAVSMFLGAVAHAPFESRHQMFLFRQGTTRSILNAPDPACPICSQEGYFGKGDSWPAPGRIGES